MKDAAAVADAAGHEAFSLIGICQGGAIAMAYASRHASRVNRLVLYGTYARGRDRRGSIPLEPEKAKVMLEMLRLGGGQEDSAFMRAFATQFQPEGGMEHLRSWCELQRRATSAENAVRMTEVMFDIDIRDLAAGISCPTLVAHPDRDAVVPIEEGRLLARTIPGAQFLSLDSPNHFILPDERAWTVFREALHAFLPAPVRKQGPFADLSPRERDVLQCLAQGLDNQQIGTRLGIGEKTVRNHVLNIFSKLQARSRAQVIVRAREAGFGKDTADR